ncbi:MAG: tyrosine--tRNA ligase [Pseudomonadota bacterium]
MTAPASDFLRALQTRGFIHQTTNMEGLDAAGAGGEPLVAYIGFDATAKSLHVGSLIQIMMLRWLQKCGHKPIVLMGGGTTKVGDPTGKDQQRKLLTDEEIAANSAGIRQVFEKFLTFGDGPSDAVMVDNADWLSHLGYLDFLRDFGPHFTINRMLTFDSVKLRLERESPMTFLEFNYMLMQAYDYYELNKTYGCRLQMGGSDQWGNIVNGVELCRRVASAEVFGLTTPLLTTASGQKMGKSEGGAMWLNADMLSPYDYWQFWRNAEDADVGRFLRLYTELDLSEIARLEALEGAEINDAKKLLATETTAMLHGRAEAERAAKTAAETFAGSGRSDDLPTLKLSAEELETGPQLVKLFVAAGLCASNGEARRHAKAGALKLNDESLADPDRPLTAGDLGPDGAAKLSVGKKRHALVRPAD